MKKKIISLMLSLVVIGSMIIPGTVASLTAEDTSDDSGLKLSKTATYNENDGTYTIKLEAYATGEKVISEVKEDIPTDIVLVLDQSGSMADTFSRTTEDSWVSYGKQKNSENYDFRMNDTSWGATNNLYYKLADGGYVEVSVDRTSETVQGYVAWTNARNSGCYNNRNSRTMYADTEEGYKEVTITRSGNNGNRRTYTYTYTLNDGTTVTRTSAGDNGNPPYTIYYVQDTYEYTYEYYYTVNGVKTTIGTLSKGADAVFDVEFYKKVTAGTSITALEALQNAVSNFAYAVSEKAKGADGVYGTADDVNHRIAVVGFATGNKSGVGYPAYENTEVFIGAAQHNYNVDASSYYGSAFQNMNTQIGYDNVIASKNALAARGATYTDLGIEMANGIFGANPIPANTQRNRVVIVFTDGIPGWNGYDSTVAGNAINQAGTAKNTYGATVYTIGIFSGADASSAGGLNTNSDADKGNYFLQQVSSNNGTPQSPSYYLSAADAGSLNSIFQQISSNIETGGSASTLTSAAVVKDIISPQFTLQEGTTATDIELETYACTGKNGSEYTWSKNNNAMGAVASIDDDQVNVTGFNFSENWCGTEKKADGTESYHGNKLVISFKVQPKDGFLGGNDVFTNTSAGVYPDSSAEKPVLSFERPQVNVPIETVTVDAKNKNVYLLGSLTADQMKAGAVVECGDVSLDLSKATDADKPYGLEPWQTKYVNITVEVRDKDGKAVTDLTLLTNDTTYQVYVKIEPKNGATSAEGTAATAQEDSGIGSIHVFKPELTFKDSEVYYGADAPTDDALASNCTGTVWKHDSKTDEDVTMIGKAPDLTKKYIPDSDKIPGGKVNTKQDIGVDVNVKIGAKDVTEHTTFEHQDCDGQTCTPQDPWKFWLHVKTCQLTITKQGGSNDESYVFTVYKDGTKYSEVSIYGNGSETIYELPVGNYTVTEDAGWSWRFSANSDKAELHAANPSGTVTCTNTANGKNQWLNGFSEIVKNIFDVKAN